MRIVEGVNWLVTAIGSSAPEDLAMFRKSKAGMCVGMSGRLLETERSAQLMAHVHQPIVLALRRPPNTWGALPTLWAGVLLQASIDHAMVPVVVGLIVHACYKGGADAGVAVCMRYLPVIYGSMVWGSVTIVVPIYLLTGYNLPDKYAGRFI